MYKTLHKKQGSVTVQLRFARSSVTFCAKRDNKSVLYLCESIIAVMMITLFFCLYISKFLRNPGEVYRGPHHPLLMVLGLTSICIVLALIQHELLSRLVKNAFSDVTGIHNKNSLEIMFSGD